jgi:hypothetical protein
MQRPPATAWPRLEETEAAQPTRDFMKYQLKPNARIGFLGQVLTVNRWGMRDKDYAQTKPAGVRRLALVGVSVDMGWGVGDAHAYESLVEHRLNAELAPRAGVTYEFLNFSIAAHTVSEHLLLLDRVLSFQPDVVMVPAHGVDASMLVDHLVERALAKVPIPIDTLRSAVEASGLGRVPEAEARKYLGAHGEELVQALYGQTVKRIRAGGALPVWFLVPVPGATPPAEEIQRLASQAGTAGFRVLDISDAYTGHDVSELRLRAFDRHPNTLGHMLLADRLYREFHDHPEVLGARNGAARPPVRRPATTTTP